MDLHGKVNKESQRSGFPHFWLSFPVLFKKEKADNESKPITEEERE
jgi:hypothetical protein